jgi:hypothetical protein
LQITCKLYHIDFCNKAVLVRFIEFLKGDYIVTNTYVEVSEEERKIKLSILEGILKEACFLKGPINL